MSMSDEGWGNALLPVDFRQNETMLERLFRRLYRLTERLGVRFGNRR